MNIIVCPLRCSLHMVTVSSLMFIQLNGPPLTKFNPTPYAKSWLVKHRGAMDPRTRPCKAGPDVEDKEALWALL